MKNHNDIYNILGKLNSLKPQEPAKDSILKTLNESAAPTQQDVVQSLNEKYQGWKKTVAAVKAGGADNPEAVAAAIGRKKYGKEKFQKAAAAGKKLGESAKPDFLDMDKDGNKKEPMKTAVKDKKKVNEYFHFDTKTGKNQGSGDELERRSKLGKDPLIKHGKEYKEKHKHGDMYKVAGPKGALPEQQVAETLRLQGKVDHSNYSYSRDSGYTAKIFKDPEWNEYVVKYYKDGQVLPSDTWTHTDDIEDAHNTAMAEIKFMASRSGEEQVDEAEMDEDMLSPKQKKIAGLRPPPDKIDGKDLAAAAGKKLGEEYQTEAVIPKGIRSNPQKLQAYVDELKREFNNLNRFARDEGMGSYRERKRDDPDHWTTTDQDKIMDALNQAKALGVVPSKPGAGKYVSVGDQLRSDSRGTMGGGLREADANDLAALRAGKKKTEGSKVDQNKDGKNDWEDVKIARMKASGAMKEDEFDSHDSGEYDREGDMAKDDIHTIVRHAEALEQILGDQENMPEWVQAKLAKIQGMMTAVDDYMQTQHERDEEMTTGEEGMHEGEYQDKVNKSKIPAFQRKAKGGDDWKLSQADLDDEASQSPTGRAGLEKLKQRMRDQGVMEGEVIKTKTGLIHKGTYGSDYEDPESKEDGAAPKKKGRPAKAKQEPRVTKGAWKHKKKVDETRKPVKLDTFVEDTMKELDNLLVMEKAVSQQQQKFMGMVYAAKKGGKPASKDVAKAAKGMSKKDAKDFASTKHKDLPKKVSEGVNFAEMMKEQHQSVEEMLQELNAHLEEYKRTGHMSDRLRDALDVHRHSKKSHSTVSAMAHKPEHEHSHDMDMHAHHELDELARLAGLSSVNEASCNMTAEGEMCPKHGFAECWSGGMMESKGEKPDFLDADKDGDKDESMKQAFADKKKNPFGNKKAMDESKCPDCGMDPCDCDHEDDKEQVDECGMPGNMSNSQESGMNINSSMDTKTGRKTLSVTADGEAAEDLAQMLKMAGLGGHHEPEHVAHEIPKIVAIGHTEGMMEAFANEPNEEYADIDTLNDQGQDLNRKKKQYADKPKAGDNPMATKEDIQLETHLAKLYDSIKVKARK